MKVEQIYTGCLAEAAYYIESNGEAAIIDPLRETAPYIQRAESDNANIKYIFETHFHADFVSGHVDLANKTGAQIVYGPTAKAEFDFIEAEDNQEFKIGNVTLKVLHTPGHTMESSTFLLIDENGKNHAIFSGDTLFLGDVGRPDLAVKSDLSKEDLAGLLFDSLRNRIMTLEDDVIVYPGHGAGSACGKNMSKETVGTLGDQKNTNYALRANMTKEEFIEELLDGILPPPQYFPKNAVMNKSAVNSIDDILSTGNTALNADEFETYANEKEALVIDTRSEKEFVKGFIPNSIFIGIDGNFASWVGTMITDIKQPILLVCDKGREEEVITRLARVGYDNILGYLEGGFQGWNKEVDSIHSISAQEFENAYSNSKINVLDVRKKSEFLSEHVIDTYNLPLDNLNSNMNELNKETTYHVHCAGGYRSVIFISILKSRGFDKLVDIAGGFNAINETSVAKTEYVCPSTL